MCTAITLYLLNKIDLPEGFPNETGVIFILLILFIILSLILDISLVKFLNN